MTNTEKILAEFDSLYEEHKEILDIPVCCTNEDCLCNKDTVWEHLKAFLTSKIAQAYQEGYEDLNGNFCLEVKEHDNKVREEMLKRVVGEIGEKRKKLWQFYHEAQLWEEQKAIVKPLDEILVFLQDINNKEDI